MALYNIYVSPQGDYVPVEQGWSWLAFFFSILWSLVKRLWLLSISFFVLFFSLGIIRAAFNLGSDGNTLINIVGWVVSIIFGATGNKLYERKLISKGYTYKQTVTATNSKEAISTYLKDNGVVRSLKIKTEKYLF